MSEGPTAFPPSSSVYHFYYIMYIVEIQESGYEGIDGKLIREELGVRS
jgi:hypothetical protein